MRLAFALAVVLGGLVAAGGAPAITQPYFQTPSKNIGCIYVAPFASTDKPYLRCDIGGGLHPAPPRPKSCDLDWAYGYAMVGGSGLARTLCAGDTARDPHAPILKYGQTWKKGPYTCVSQAIGLRCTNLVRHGFFLSRQRSYTF